MRNGELVQVTDRGTVVAELRAPGHRAGSRDVPAGLLELARRQEVSLGEPNDPALYELGKQPLLRGTTAAELLDEERGER